MARPRDAVLLLLLAGVYIAAGRFGLSLAFENASASAVWPPTGIAIAAMLILGRRVWPAVAAGAFVVNLGVTGAVASSLAIAAGNTAEALLAARLVTRFADGRRALESVSGLLKFVAFAGLLAPTVSATVGVASLTLGGHAAPDRLLAIWVTWWLGNMVGALLVAPAILLWHASPSVSWSPRRAVEAALWIALLLVVSVSFFTNVTPEPYRLYIRPFPLIPLLICIAIRFGRREAAIGLMLLASVAIWGTVHGYGPFLLPTTNESLLLVQSFLAAASVLTLVPAVLTYTQRRAESRLQAFFDQAVVGIADCDFDGRILRVNQHFCDMLGYSSEALLGRSLIDLTHADDRATTRARLQRLETDGTPNTLEKRYLRADGTTLWVRALASRVVPSPERDAYVATVVEDITARRQAEGAMERAARVEERGRLAGEIHDHLSQSFVGIVLQLENAAEVLPPGSEDARAHLDRATRLARTALDHARRSTQDLAPATLDSHELPAALRATAAAALAGTGVSLDFQCDGEARRLSVEIEEQLYYIGQEAIANIWRHGVPRTLTCRLRYDASELQMEVADDGTSSESIEDGFYGLVKMHDRARRIGARIVIQSDPGQRNSVLVHLPLGSASAGGMQPPRD